MVSPVISPTKFGFLSHDGDPKSCKMSTSEFSDDEERSSFGASSSSKMWRGFSRKQSQKSVLSVDEKTYKDKYLEMKKIAKRQSMNYYKELQIYKDQRTMPAATTDQTYDV